MLQILLHFTLEFCNGIVQFGFQCRSNCVTLNIHYIFIYYVSTFYTYKASDK